MEQTQEHKVNPSSADRYLDLQKLSDYASVAIPTLREHLRRGTLPHYKLRGKILVKRSEFDEWMRQFKVDQGDDLEDLVEETISALKH
jgi:excisionase family DNA binding protein